MPVIGAKVGLRSLFVVLLVVTGATLAAGYVASASGGDEFSEGGGEVVSVDGLFQGSTTNAVLYVLPTWVGLVDLGVPVVFVITLLVRGATEPYWTTGRLGAHWPLRIERGG